MISSSLPLLCNTLPTLPNVSRKCIEFSKRVDCLFSVMTTLYIMLLTPKQNQRTDSLSRRPCQANRPNHYFQSQKEINLVSFLDYFLDYLAERRAHYQYSDKHPDNRRYCEATQQAESYNHQRYHRGDYGSAGAEYHEEGVLQLLFQRRCFNFFSQCLVYYHYLAVDTAS